MTPTRTKKAGKRWTGWALVHIGHKSSNWYHPDIHWYRKSARDSKAIRAFPEMWRIVPCLVTEIKPKRKGRKS